ncbi:MAG TPA: DUF3035 domain-containing protein [Alphaproteobacteria bacterium]
MIRRHRTETPNRGVPCLRGWAQAAVAALAVAMLAGCGGDTRKVLGLDKVAPDEFKIVNRAPLSLPPDYALRPPDPGALRPQEQTIPQRAITAVTGTAPAANAGSSLSPGESALIAHAGAGAGQADSKIREVVDRENSTIVTANSTFMDHLMFWRTAEDPSSVVDAPRESQRLRENAALGKPVDDGQTPTITRRKKALLEGIF